MRIKAGVYSRQRKKKVFRIAKGYYSNKRNRWRMAIQQVEKSLRYAYTGRRDKKGNFRQLWIARINAALEATGISYSKFINGLKRSNILLDRKSLAGLALKDNPGFRHIVDLVCAPTQN